MRGRRTARVGRARLSIVKPIQGGRNGLIAALFAGRVDPLSAKPDNDEEPWRYNSAADLRAIENKRHRRKRLAMKRRAEEPPF